MDHWMHGCGNIHYSHGRCNSKGKMQQQKVVAINKMYMISGKYNVVVQTVSSCVVINATFLMLCKEIGWFFIVKNLIYKRSIT